MFTSITIPEATMLLASSPGPHVATGRAVQILIHAALLQPVLYPVRKGRRRFPCISRFKYQGLSQSIPDVPGESTLQKCTLGGVYRLPAVEESPSSVLLGSLPPGLEDEHLAERIAKHRPFPQGARGRHTLASKILSPNGITRSVSSWEEVGGDRTCLSRAEGHPHSLRPHWRWGFSGKDSGYSKGGLTQTRGSLVYPGHPPHTPAQLLPFQKGRSKSKPKRPLSTLCPAWEQAFNHIPGFLGPGPNKPGETAASRPPSEERISPFVCAAFLLPALADAILQTAPPRLCQGSGARPPSPTLGAGGALLPNTQSLLPL